MTAESLWKLANLPHQDASADHDLQLQGNVAKNTLKTPVTGTLKVKAIPTPTPLCSSILPHCVWLGVCGGMGGVVAWKR